MPENFSASAVEAEIAELQKLIEAKRDFLEQQNNIVEEKELVRGAVTEYLNRTLSQPTNLATKAAASPATGSTTSYLDHLDSESVQALNSFIEDLPKIGIAKTITQVEAVSPFLLDAFHDALVDKLYDDLKARGIVK